MSNGADEAKRLMEQMKSAEIKSAESSNPDESKFIADATLQNLVNESHKSNQLLPVGGLVIKPDTYQKIEKILKDGGMDSSSVIKSLNAIKEILNVQEEVPT